MLLFIIIRIIIIIVIIIIVVIVFPYAPFSMSPVHASLSFPFTNWPPPFPLNSISRMTKQTVIRVRRDFVQPRRLTISLGRRSFEGRLIATDLPRHRDQRRTIIRASSVSSKGFACCNRDTICDQQRLPKSSIYRRR